MILWHLGTAALITYVALGRRRIDYRFILLGALAPDAVDGVLGLVVFDGDSGRWIAHTILAVVVVTVFVLVAFKGPRRQSLFGLGVGWLLHLVADGMWMAPRTFLWPAFGTAWQARPAEPYSVDLFLHPLDHAWTWAGEVAGVAVLWWFWVAFRMGTEDRARLFLKDGYLRP